MKPFVQGRRIPLGIHRALSALLLVSFSAFVSIASVGCVSDEDPSSAALSESGGALQVPSTGGRTELTVEVPAGGLHTGPNTLALSAATWEGAPARVRILSVRAVMVAHNHEADPPVLSAQGDGVTDASIVFFMSGRWEIEVRVEANGATDTVTFPVDVP
jgi:hypothetical protein